MPDTVYDKLDRIEDKVDALSPSANSEPQTLDEQLAAKDPRVFEFIKNADRVLYYDGDKSELKRKNAYNKKARIVLTVTSIIMVAYCSVSSFLLYIPFGIIFTICALLTYAPFIMKAFTYHPSEYRVPYDKWFLKTAVYEYDDNDILCGMAKDKWYIILSKLIALLCAYIYPFVCMFAFLITERFAFGLLFFLLGYALATVWQVFLNKRNRPYYYLVFEDEKSKVAYERLKEFMTENNLK